LPPVAVVAARTKAGSSLPLGAAFAASPSGTGSSSAVGSPTSVTSARAPVGVGRPRRHHDRQGKVLDPPGEEGQRDDGRLVGPVHGIDGEPERPALAEIAKQQYSPCSRALAGRGAAEVEHRVRVPGRARGDGRPVRARQPGRTERLAQHAVREGPLALGAASVQNPHAELLRVRSGGAEEARLADARRPLDHREPAIARARLGQRDGEHEQAEPVDRDAGRQGVRGGDADQCERPRAVGLSAEGRAGNRAGKTTRSTVPTVPTVRTILRNAQGAGRQRAGNDEAPLVKPGKGGRERAEAEPGH